MTNAEDRSGWATGRLLSTAARLTEQNWNARLRDSGVSHAGLIVLHMLSQGPASQRELAEGQFLTEQTIGRTLTHLESTGHVGRATDSADRRRRVVQITDPGRDLLSAISDSGDRLTDHVLLAGGVAPADFRAALQLLIDALDSPQPPEAPSGDAPDRPS